MSVEFSGQCNLCRRRSRLDAPEEDHGICRECSEKRAEGIASIRHRGTCWCCRRYAELHAPEKEYGVCDRCRGVFSRKHSNRAFHASLWFAVVYLVTSYLINWMLEKQ